MTEKPLNVRVAEALGCRPGTVGDWICTCADRAHGKPWNGGPRAALPWLLPYGEDSPDGWACTGPLLSKLQISIGVTVWPRPNGEDEGPDAVEWGAKAWDARAHGDARTATAPPGWMQMAFGANPSEAIAYLIIALAEAGRLPK